MSKSRRSLRPKRRPRTIYLTDEHYDAFFVEAAAKDMTFSDWMRLAATELAAKQVAWRKRTGVPQPVATYNDPAGVVQWPVNVACWCGQCHDPWLEHPLADPPAGATELDDAVRNKKRCTVQHGN